MIAAGGDGPGAVVHVAVDRDPLRTSRALGGATDALHRGAVGAIVVDLGALAVDPGILGALSRWERRVEPLIRARRPALVFVVPGFWHALQWRVITLLEPSSRMRVVRSMQAAEGWLARCSGHAAMSPAPSSTPS